ncbi:hypothetical protein [Streptomyces sp. NPDC054838]
MKPGDDATPNRLTTTRPSGKTETDLVVDFDLYRAVHSGSAVDLDIWKDHIVKISAAGKSSRIEHTALPATVRIWLLLTFGTLTALVCCAGGQRDAMDLDRHLRRPVARHLDGLRIHRGPWVRRMVGCGNIHRVLATRTSDYCCLPHIPP